MPATPIPMRLSRRPKTIGSTPGPHLMIVGSKEVLAGPSDWGEAGHVAPYVMWAGTPYAHLMVPVAASAATQ